MPRTLQLVLFVLLALAVVGGAHTYIWLRLVRDTGLTAPWRSIATWVLIALALSLPAAFPLARVFDPGTATKYALFLPYLWMGMMVLLLTLLAAGDLTRLGVRLGAYLLHRGNPQSDPARALLGARILAGGALGLSVVLAAVALHLGLRAPVVKRVRVELPNLPEALDGTTIAQITDLHLGPTLGRDWLADVVRRTNELRPDVIAITGDLMDGSVEQLRDVVAPLADLRARHGVYFVTGNHEYYSGVDAWLPELERLGVKVLHNERVSIGDGEASFDLAGIDDASAAGFSPGHGPDLRGALAGRDPSRALVLLAHQPRAIGEAAAAGVGLVLSGHTHGGQFWPWMCLVHLQQPYLSGLHRHDRTWIYVSDGTGFWGPPLRLGTSSEITLVTAYSVPAPTPGPRRNEKR